MKQFLMNFARDEQGQDLVEYALLLALVALGAVAILTQLGGTIKTTFENANSAIKGAPAE